MKFSLIIPVISSASLILVQAAPANPKAKAPAHQPHGAPAAKTSAYPQIFEKQNSTSTGGEHGKKNGTSTHPSGAVQSVISSLQPAAQDAGTALATQVVEVAANIMQKIFGSLQASEHADAKRRGDFTTGVVTGTKKVHPGWNVVVVDSAHTKKFDGTENKDWAHRHQDIKLSTPGVKAAGYEIYTFRSGEFTLTGDGGDENWAYGGQVKVDPKNKKHLTFSKSNNAKGSALQAENLNVKSKSPSMTKSYPAKGSPTPAYGGAQPSMGAAKKPAAHGKGGKKRAVFDEYVDLE